MQWKLERHQHSELRIDQIASIQTKSWLDSLDKRLQVLALKRYHKPIIKASINIDKNKYSIKLDKRMFNICVHL